MNGPCPTCGEKDGFHNDAVHRTVEIPRDKIKDKGWHLSQP